MNRDNGLLILENIHKGFSHNGTLIEVLRGIDLVVLKGETLAIMGSSGVGKTTLMNIMGTLEPPTRGRVHFDNRNIYEMRKKPLSRLRNREIGFVFQFHNLLPEFDALENTIMPALIARLKKQEALEMAERVLVKVGLERRLNHRIGELSGGEQQRVAIARSLIMGPRLLLADEPTGNLDRKTGEGITELLLQLNMEEDLAMVIATHNQLLAERMSKQMEIIDGYIS